MGTFKVSFLDPSICLLGLGRKSSPHGLHQFPFLKIVGHFGHD